MSSTSMSQRTSETSQLWAWIHTHLLSWPQASTSVTIRPSVFLLWAVTCSQARLEACTDFRMYQKRSSRGVAASSGFSRVGIVENMDGHLPVKRMSEASSRIPELMSIQTSPESISFNVAFCGSNCHLAKIGLLVLRDLVTTRLRIHSTIFNHILLHWSKNITWFQSYGVLDAHDDIQSDPQTLFS